MRTNSQTAALVPPAWQRLRRTALLLALYASVSVITRFVVLRADIVNGDEASYLVGAWETLRGHLPYTAFGDNKPPLIYAYYVLTQIVAGHGIFAVRLVTMLVTVPLTAFAASAFYRHSRLGVTAALAFLVYSASYEASEMLAVNCELVMLLPLAYALVLVRDGKAGTSARRAFGAGALLGVGTLVKYQAALWAPAVVIALVLDASKDEWKATLGSMAALAAGFLLPLFVTAGVFAVLGGFEGFWYWNVTHNIGYVLNPTTAWDAFELGLAKVVPFVIVTAVLWVGWIRSMSLNTSRYRRHLIGGVVAASAVAGVLGLRFFPHYFVQLYIPLALGSAPWIAEALVWPLGTAGRRITAWSLTALVAFTASNFVRYVATSHGVNATSHRIANQLRADPCYAGGTMFVWGSAPTLYYHAQLPLASRFFYPEFPLIRYYVGSDKATALQVPGRVRDRPDQLWQWLMTDLERHQPTYVLDMSSTRVARWDYFPLGDYPTLQHFVIDSYEPMAAIDGVQIYRRRGCQRVSLPS